MTTIAAGASASYTFLDALTALAISLDSNERALIEVRSPAGALVYSDRLSSSRTVGPFPLGYTATLTADSGAIDFGPVRCPAQGQLNGEQAGAAASQLSRNPPFSFSSPNTPAPLAQNVGTKLVDISTATTTGLTSASVATSGLALSAGGKALQITGNGAATPSADISAFGTGLASFPVGTQNRSIGFWAYKPYSGVPSPLTIYLATSSGFSIFSNCNVLIYPGLHFYEIPLPMGVTSAWTSSGGGIFGQTCAYIRFKQNVFASNYPVMVTGGGDYIQIGDIYLDPQIGRPRVVFDFDGNNPEMIYSGANGIAGYDGVVKNHSFLSFLATYGWSGSCGIITGAIGSIANTMAWRDWQEARDKYGAAIISHTHYHVQQTDVAGAVANSGGYPLQGPVGFALVGAVAQTAASSGLQFTPTNDITGIQADIDLSLGLLQKKGFYEGTRHIMLSQGGYDMYTNQALETYGFKSVRGSVNIAAICGNSLGVNTVPTAGSGQFTDCQSVLVNRQACITPEITAMTSATMQTFINMLIVRGGIGSIYTHTFGSNAQTLDNYKRFCDLIKAAELAGLLDVITPYALGSQ